MSTVIAFVAEYLYMGIVLAEGLYLIFAFRNHWKKLLTATLFIGVIAFVISLIANRIISDPRPFILSGARPMIPSSTDNGFPSDHTLLLATIAAILFIFNRPIGLFGLLAAFTIGMARVYAGVHHVEDVLGSLAIAMIALALYAAAIWARNISGALCKDKRGESRNHGS